MCFVENVLCIYHSIVGLDIVDFEICFLHVLCNKSIRAIADDLQTSKSRVHRRLQKIYQEINLRLAGQPGNICYNDNRQGSDLDEYGTSTAAYTETNAGGAV